MEKEDDSEGEWCKPKKTIRRTVDKTKRVKVFLDLDTTKVPEDKEQMVTLTDEIENALQTLDGSLTVGEISCFGLDEPPNRVLAIHLRDLGYTVTLNPRRVEFCKKNSLCQPPPRLPKKPLTELIMTKEILLHCLDYFIDKRDHPSRLISPYILVISGDHKFGGLVGELRKITEGKIIAYNAVCDNSLMNFFQDKESTWLWSVMKQGGRSIHETMVAEEAKKKAEEEESKKKAGGGKKVGRR